MATSGDNSPYGLDCTFQWKIVNLSHCFWMGENVEIKSPVFAAGPPNGTKWNLSLYPAGEALYENFVGLFLEREDNNEPKTVRINYMLAFQNRYDMLSEHIMGSYSFKSGSTHGNQRFAPQRRVFLTEKDSFLPEDTLTVLCTMSETSRPIKSNRSKHVHARTVFQANRRSVLWKINDFSTVQSDLRNKFKDNLIDLDLILTNGDFKIDMISVDDSIKYFSVNISVVDSRSKKDNCGCRLYEDPRPTFIWKHKIPIGVSYVTCLGKYLFKHETTNTPNDVLTLDIEYIYSTVNNSFVSFDWGTNSSKSVREVSENCIEHHARKERSQNVSLLTENLKSMFTDGFFSDAQLCTPSQTFLVHRNILSARSPVFRQMFSSDMKETISGNINISDIEDDTVHRMLLFVYTESIGDLQVESAAKLYEAADKYEILSLRRECSSFLKDNLCPTKACDVLLLADLHQDQDLKSFVQAYILEHCEVFGLQEWIGFMETNIKLAAEIMYKKCKM